MCWSTAEVLSVSLYKSMPSTNDMRPQFEKGTNDGGRSKEWEKQKNKKKKDDENKKEGEKDLSIVSYPPIPKKLSPTS